MYSSERRKRKPALRFCYFNLRMSEKSSTFAAAKVIRFAMSDNQKEFI